MSDTQATQVSSQFARTPQNPNVQSPTNSPIPSEGQPPAQSSSTPTPPSAPGQGVDDKLNFWLNNLNSAPGTPTQGTEKESPQPGAAPTPSPSSAPITQVVPPAPQQPTIPPEWSTQYAMMQRQNQDLQNRLQQQEQVIQNLMQSQQEYADLKTQVDANNMQFGELATVEANDAKAIAAGIMQAVNAQLAPIKEALQQQQNYTQQSNQWQEQRFVQQQAQDTIRRISAAHPDFMALQNNPDYLRFVQQRDGSSSLTYDAIAAYEFRQGNADYIIDLINKFKGQQGNNKPTDITTVAPVSTASAPEPANVQQPALPTLQELNQWMQMHRITQDQYRQLLQKVIAAQRG